MSRWRPALRVARREALRARGRSALVVTMIALPVLGVTAADVVIQTGDIKGVEAIERKIGTADALVSVDQGTVRVAQTPDPDQGGMTGDHRRSAEPRTLEDVEEALGRELSAVELVRGYVRVSTDAGLADVDVTETDLTSDLTRGLYRIDEGRVPVADHEVAINHALAERGLELGDELAVEGGPYLTVVGIGDNTSYRGSPQAVAPPGTFDLTTPPGQHRWLVDAGGAVTWEDVRALNAIGATVISEAVLRDPPADSELDPELQGWATGGADSTVIAVFALVVVMALLEVVLLAGPAFAVMARRMQHSLALMAATGATPRQARRVMLASGLVLGLAGAGLGVALGLLVAWLSLPLVQQLSDSFLGPYDVPWLHVAGIAGFGLVSAFLAAVVPAWLASRQDVVAVLAGRRGDQRPSLRSPLLGLVLLGAGVAVATSGARRPDGGELLIAAAAVVAVLGMILLVPIVVVGVARLGRFLPLPLRYAVRDAARQRARTVPAVAAVAATVAGVVALGIANASDAEQAERTYTPMLAEGQGSLTAWGAGGDLGWERLAAVTEQHVPGAQVTPVQGVGHGGRRSWTEVRFHAAGGERVRTVATGSSFATETPVSSDGEIPAVVTGLDEAEVQAGREVLARGGAIVFADQDPAEDMVALSAWRYSSRGSPDLLGRAEVPALVLRSSAAQTSFQAVLSERAAAAVGVEPVTAGLLVDGVEISEEQERDVSEALAVLSPDLSLYVERGFEHDDETTILLLVLGALGGVLMLGGTLTATFLSLSDARPDLATLSAVGASPRTRRAVAAAYALVIGLVGAVLGAGVGAIPGVAVTYPLTGQDWVQDIDPGLPDHFLAVPWLLIGSIVVALPLLTAAVVALATRSRMPLVARVD